MKSLGTKIVEEMYKSDSHSFKTLENFIIQQRDWAAYIDNIVEQKKESV